jgi:predicted nucleic acid-binding protein
VKTLLLDASVLLAAFDPDDDNHDASVALLETSEISLATLDLARYEVANVAVRAWRSPELVSVLLTAIDRISDDGGTISSTSVLLASAGELAEEHGISVHDAAYAAAAADAGHRLISCDRRDLVANGLADLPSI